MAASLRFMLMLVGEERCNSSVQKTEISSFIPPERLPDASLNKTNAPLEADIQYKRKKKVNPCDQDVSKGSS